MPIHTRTNHGALIPINETPPAKPQPAEPVLTPQAAVTVELLGQLHQTLAHLRLLIHACKLQASENNGMESIHLRLTRQKAEKWTDQFPM